LFCLDHVKNGNGFDLRLFTSKSGIRDGGRISFVLHRFSYISPKIDGLIVLNRRFLAYCSNISNKDFDKENDEKLARNKLVDVLFGYLEKAVYVFTMINVLTLRFCLPLLKVIDRLLCENDVFSGCLEDLFSDLSLKMDEYWVR